MQGKGTSFKLFIAVVALVWIVSPIYGSPRGARERFSPKEFFGECINRIVKNVRMREVPEPDLKLDPDFVTYFGVHKKRDVAQGVWGRYSVRLVRISKRKEKNPPVVVLFPGKGLSGRTMMQTLAGLSTGIDVVFVDPPGTGPRRIYTREGPGITWAREADYTPACSSPDATPDAALMAHCDAIQSALQYGFDGYYENSPVVFVGHSFGGVIAVELLLRGEMDGRGFIAIASPLSRELDKQARNPPRAGDEFQRLKKAFTENPSAQNYYRLLVEGYGNLMFTPETRETMVRRLLERDPYSIRALIDLRVDWPRFTKRMAALRDRPDLLKMVIAGENDPLVRWQDLETVSSDLNASFELVRGGSHWPFIDDSGKGTVIDMFVNARRSTGIGPRPKSAYPTKIELVPPEQED